MPDLATIRLEGDAAKELESYRERLRETPEESGLNGAVGMLLHSQGRIEAAEAFYHRARALAPAAPRWAYLHGVTLEELERGFDAAEAFGKVLERREGHGPSLIRLAALYLRMAESGQESLAAEGKALLEKALAEHPDSPRGHFEMGRLLAAEDDLESAANHLEEALELGGDFEAGHEAAAEVYTRLGEERLAERHRALAATSRGVEAPLRDRWMSEVEALAIAGLDYARRGEELIKRGLLSAAVPEMENAVAADPEDTDSRNNLAVLHLMLGDRESAKEQYQELISREPDHSRAHLNLGTIALSEGDWETAIREYQRAIDRDPYLIKAYIGLSRAYSRQGRTAEAVRQLERAVVRNRHHAAALSELGERLAEQGRYEEAIQRLEQAMQYSRFQETLPVARKLAAVCFEAGLEQRAVETLKLAYQEAQRRDDNVTAALIRNQLREYGAL